MSHARNGGARGIAAALAAAATIALAGCGDLYSRETFTSSVMHKSPDEVRKNIGKPIAEDQSNPAQLTWVYENVTFDVENKNKRDPKAMVIFGPKDASGRQSVTEVKFGS